MSYPGVDPQDFAPSASGGVQVAQTVPPARPQYGGSSWAAPREFDFQTPSGAWCRIRKVRQEDALAMGLINHLDVFSPKLLRDAKGRSRPAEEVEEAIMQKLSEGNKTQGFFDTIKRVVMRAVVAPKLVDDEDSETVGLPEGTYSIANVDTKDRMAIFYAAIGEDMQKIDQFRGGQDSGVGAVESGEGVQHESGPAARNP